MSQKMKYSTYILLVRKELSEANVCTYICIANTEALSKLYTQGKDYSNYAKKLKAYITKLFKEEKKLREICCGCELDYTPNTLSNLMTKRYPGLGSIKSRKQFLLDYANYMKARKQ